MKKKLVNLMTSFTIVLGLFVGVMNVSKAQDNVINLTDELSGIITYDQKYDQQNNLYEIVVNVNLNESSVSTIEKMVLTQAPGNSNSKAYLEVYYFGVHPNLTGTFKKNYVWGEKNTAVNSIKQNLDNMFNTDKEITSYSSFWPMALGIEYKDVSGKWNMLSEETYGGKSHLMALKEKLGDVPLKYDENYRVYAYTQHYQLWAVQKQEDMSMEYFKISTNLNFPVKSFDDDKVIYHISLKDALEKGSKNIELSTDTTINDNMEIPEGRTLTVADGVTLTIAEGKTLTNNGTINGTVNGTVVVPLKNIQLDKTSLTLKTLSDPTAKLKPILTPSNTTDTTVIWKSSDEKVATVKDGVVTAVDEGKATITATVNGKQASCKVVVNKEYSVIFDEDGKGDSAIVTEGELVKSYTPVRGGYTFKGWYLDDKLFDFNTPITKNMTLKAKWEIIPGEEEVKAPTIDTTQPVKEVTIGVDKAEKVEEVVSNSIEKDTTLKTKVDAAIAAGKDVNTEVVVKKVEETKLDATVKKEIDEKIKDKDLVVAQYLDLSIVVSTEDEVLGNVTELTEAITYKIAIPTDLAKEGREFVVVRVHNGVAEILPTTMNDDGTLSFKTDRFSTYALVYKDANSKTDVTVKPDETVKPTTPEKEETVNTGDQNNVALYASLCTLALLGAGIVVLNKKREELLNK